MRAHEQILGAVPQRGLHQLHRERQHRVGVLAARPHVHAHAVVAEVGEAHVVELQVAAARGVEVGDLRAVGGRGVLDEGVQVGVDRAIDVGPPDLGVEHARRRDRELGGAGRDRLQEPERVHEDRRGPAHARGDCEIGPREVHVARAPVEGHRQLAPLAGEPAEPGEEVHVPGLAAHLAVGDALEPGLLLQTDRVANRRVLGGAERGRAAPTLLALEAQGLQRGRAQQAAHVVGAERRTRRRHRRFSESARL